MQTQLIRVGSFWKTCLFK